MAQKTKHDWLYEGAQLLAEFGSNNIKIDWLTKRMDVTKGSFYHHFKNYEDYKINLLDFIEQQGTLRIIEEMEEGATASEKINRLLELTVTDSPDLEVALRAWAWQDETVREYVERIDGRRITYIQQLALELTGDEAKAKIMGQMFYAIYVGGHHTLPPIMGEDLMLLYGECKRLYGVADS